jgi:hypothetical protein
MTATHHGFVGMYDFKEVLGMGKFSVVRVSPLSSCPLASVSLRFRVTSPPCVSAVVLGKRHWYVAVNEVWEVCPVLHAVQKPVWPGQRSGGGLFCFRNIPRAGARAAGPQPRPPALIRDSRLGPGLARLIPARGCLSAI